MGTIIIVAREEDEKTLRAALGRTALGPFLREVPHAGGPPGIMFAKDWEVAIKRRKELKATGVAVTSILDGATGPTTPFATAISRTLDLTTAVRADDEQVKPPEPSQEEELKRESSRAAADQIVPPVVETALPVVPLDTAPPPPAVATSEPDTGAPTPIA